MTDSLPQRQQSTGDTSDGSDALAPAPPLSGEQWSAYLRDVAPGSVLVKILQAQDEEIGSVAVNYMMDAVEEMAPRDTLERMLVQQLVLSHHRAVRLSGLATQQTTLDAIKVTNEAADRVLGSFRRGMLALREYRAPYRRVSIGQLNQANQQNVAYVERADTEKLNAPAKKRDERTRHEGC